jgi:hypothetical protein
VDVESQPIEGRAGETFLAERGGSKHRTATTTSSGGAGETVWALGWRGHSVSPAEPQGIAHRAVDHGWGESLNQTLDLHIFPHAVSSCRL